MPKSNLLFYGLGGAGTRHYNIIKNILKKKLNLFYYTKNIRKYSEFNFKKEKNFKSALKNKKFIIISSPTYNHVNTAIKAANSNVNIFCEKPFYSTLKKFILFSELIKKKKLKFLVGYQRRYHILVKIFEKFLKPKKILKVIIVVNSYVPFWRKNINFKNLYACQKKLGGGSILTESHELDFVLKNFGLPNFISCIKYYKKSLKLDCETSHKSIFYYENFKVFFYINMFNKNLKREIIVFYDKKILTLNLQKNIILKKKLSHNKNIIVKKSGINENHLQFVKQFRYFFSSKKYSNFELDMAYKNILVINAMKKSSFLKGIKIKTDY